MKPTSTTAAPATPVRRSLPRRIARVAWKITSRLVLLVLVLVTIAVVLLHTDWGQDKLRGFIEDKLNERTTSKVTIGDLDFSFGDGITLRRITVNDAAGAPAIVIDRAQAAPRWRSLASSQPVIDLVAIDGVKVELHVRQDGTSNLTGLMKPQPPGGKPKPLAVSAFRVTGIDLDINMFDGRRTTLTGMALTGRGALDAAAGTGDMHADLKVARILAIGAGIEIEFTNLTSVADARFVGGRGTISVGPITAGSSVARPDHPRYAVEVGLASAVATVEPGDITFEVRDLRGGPLSLTAATLHPRYDRLRLAGIQRGAITGLTVSAAQVNQLVGRPTLAGDVTIAATVDGPPGALVVAGQVTTPGGALALGGTVSIVPTSPSYDLRLTSPAFSPKLVAVAPAMPEVALGALDVKVAGQGPDLPTMAHQFDFSLTGTTVRGVPVDRVAMAGTFKDGVLAVPTVTVVSGGQSVTTSVDYTAETPTTPARLVVEVKTVASIAETLAVLRAAGIPVKPVPAMSRVELDGPMALRLEGDPKGRLVVTTDAMAVRLRGGGRIRAKGGASFHPGDVAAGEPALVIEEMHGDVALQGLSLRALAALQPRRRGTPPPPAGAISGTVTFSGTPAAPAASAAIRLALADGSATASVRGGLRGQRLSAHAIVEHVRGVYAAMDLTGSPRANRTSLALRGDVRQAKDGPVLATIAGDATVKGPLARAAKAPVTWSMKIDAPRTSLATLPLPPETLAALHPDAAAAMTLSARGTRHDVAADLAVALDDVKDAAKVGLGPLDLALQAHVGAAATTANVVVSADGANVATLDATAGLGGDRLLDALATKRRLDPSLDVTLDVARREVAALAGDPRAPGTVGGQVRITGTASAPRVDGEFTAEGLTSLDGAATGATIALAGGRDRFTTTVTMADALTLGIVASPQAYLDAIARPDGGPVAVEVALTAASTPLDRLLPDLPALRPYRSGVGQLTSDLGGTVTLHATKAGAVLDDVALRGALDVTGAKVAIPRSARVMDGIALKVVGDGDVVRLDRLEAHERDLEKDDRRVLVTGAYELKTKMAKLAIEAHDMLVWGGEMGEADAPRASINATMEVVADLAQPVKQVDVTVTSLKLYNPDRYPLSHQPEALSRGDVIELGGATQVGQLQRARPLAPTPVRGPKGLELRVHIPEPIHIENRPLNLYATGEILVEQYGKVMVMSGGLTGTGGDLRVSGNDFPFDRGGILLGEVLPRLDLHFKLPPPLVARRDFATAYEDHTYMHVEGPMGLHKLSTSGYADALFDGLSLANGGRPRVLSWPEAAGSATAQLPTLRELQITGFVRSNLPYLAFLTRMNTYADPNVSRFAYGRFEHLNAERFLAGGSRRLRFLQRPPTMGQSSGEVELDHLFVNTERSVAGVGVVAGTRGGGGVAVFWEWSSAE